MYSMLFKDILFEIEEDETKAMNDLVTYYHNQDISEVTLEKFQREYLQNSPVWCYTRATFLFGTLNKALRLLDMETMIKMGFFIRNLHRQLQRLHKEQSRTLAENFIVYRGQMLTQKDFQRLLGTKGGLLSFNNFLSTSKQKDVAMFFAPSAPYENEDIVGVLFLITVDQSRVLASSNSFAVIDDYSAHPQEEEILFTMHTVFRVVDIKQVDSNNRLWEVQLTMTSDNDPQLAALSHRMKEEINGKGWHRMGKLMLQVGHFNQAEELYNELLENASDDGDKGFIYNQLGEAKLYQGKYNEAALFYEKSLELCQRTVPEDHPDLTASYHCIALVYDSMGDYSKALEFYEKAHKIYEKAVPPNQFDLAISFNNIGLVYYNMGDYARALEFYEKANKINQQTLPANHPHIAADYNNIGLVYNMIGEYSKALEFSVKDLEIMRKTLPSNHPDIAMSYSSLGKIYRNMKNYSNALTYFEESLTIREQALAETHPSRAVTYSDIGDVHRLMGEYEKALTFHQKSLKIQENVKCNPLECARTYKNLGETYREMSDYVTALTYFQKGLKIYEEKLPKNHSDFAVIYHSMAKLYFSTGEYTRAMENVQQAVDIGQKKLSSSHPHLLEYRETFEKIRKTH
ncbi:unnamed protein product [Rotaria magnacalcarata]|uniref:NAD(P)(+)--arginine ADP-ribosyltransferase n=3 Tax=Rotaria magnacalcarata TaxID=392030 RepID=A0A816Z648_9BILA|nr:unnamed protein product [Rotaria magnacalcarata]